jgi:virginiamycin A acetyltransferase
VGMGPLRDEPGLRWCAASHLLLRGARVARLRRACVSIACRLEGGDYFSGTLRAVLERHYGVRVGAYSYGECLYAGMLPPGVTIGRYVSMAAGVRVFLRNHPMDRLSMHPFFYNAALGMISKDSVVAGTLSIGHDAWIGERAIFTPGCRRVGIGAVVGAGAVVTRDVPDFGVVAGNPAKLLRHRFPDHLQAAILQSCWWELRVEDLTRDILLMLRPVEEVQGHPLLQPQTAHSRTDRSALEASPQSSS